MAPSSLASKALVVGVSVVLTFGFCLRAVSGSKTNAYVLQDHRSYSLVISVTNQNAFKTSGNDSQVFTVQAPKYHRVMIVIQQLYLWPEIDKDMQSYLMFVDSDGDTTSPKIYGNIDPDETDLVPQYLTGPRSFISSEDTASLVFINLRPDHHVISSKNERRVYAKVVFTAFRDTCSYRYIPPPPENTTTTLPPTTSSPGIIRRGDLLYRSCTTSTASGKNCIVADLFCDENINCAETDEGSFGTDERYLNCDLEKRGSASRSFSTTSEASPPSSSGSVPGVVVRKADNGGGDLIKTLIVNGEYDEYFTDMFKSVIIGFLGLCTTCILVAFIVTMFCLRPNRSESSIH